MLTFLRYLLELITFILAFNATATLGWMLYAWRDEESYSKTSFPTYTGSEEVSISLLIPARHEEAVLGDTIARVAESNYKNFEVLVIIGHDDPVTEKVARDAASRSAKNVRVIIDHSVPKTKPSALNTGLTHCSGELVGIIDAEDEVSKDLLSVINATYQVNGSDVIQGGVQLINFRSTWFSLRNCLEYYLWYRSRLHWQAKKGFIPLGGNTVFIRRSILPSVGGWDSSCLTEDCDLGIRLGVKSAKITVGHSADVSTLEETPLKLGTFIRQRTRWSQGFLQVYKKGEWKDLPTWRDRMLARYTLATPFLQSMNTFSFILAILGVLYLSIGENQAMFMFLPLLLLLLTVVFELITVAEMGFEFERKIRIRDYIILIASLIPYQLVLSWSALVAVARQMAGRTEWHKTSHVGAHRTPVLVQTRSPVVMALSDARDALGIATAAEN